MVDPDGRTVKTFNPTAYHQVMSAKTAAEVNLMMRTVVDEGTGTPAKLGSGIPFAGKTGTASIGTTGSGLTQPWFIGFAPANNPKVAIAVTIEKTQGQFGGQVAAPIARDIVQALLGEGKCGDHHGPRADQERTLMADPVPNTMVDGRYRVVSRLGSGGMADVFLAEDQQLGRKVALKLLHHRFAQDPDFVERFRREAQAAAGLQHPNVVSVYDRGTFDDTYYIAMEYLPGRSLKQLIRDEAPLDPLRAIDITIQILKAARFAHRRGVIHRDLKPHNVIVDDSGHAKVTDFGIARAGASDMTETGSIMGTAQYLSPEQAQGHAVNAGSDLYSVGVVLYEMLTGRVPFEADSAVSIALKHVSEAPPPPSSINPNIPPELEQTVLWVLNKNASDRPADADQLITVLEHCREAISSAGAGQHTASMAAVAAAGAAAGAGAAIVGPGLAAYQHAQSQATNGSGEMSAVRPPEDREGRGWALWGWVLLVVLLIAGAAAAAYFLTRPKQVLVPKVIGEQVSTARATVEQAKFQVSTVPVVNRRPDGHRRLRVAGGRHQGRQGVHGDAERLDRPGQRVGALGAGAHGGAGHEGPQAVRAQDLERGPAELQPIHRGPGDGHQSGDGALGASRSRRHAVRLHAASRRRRSPTWSVRARPRPPRI